MLGQGDGQFQVGALHKTGVANVWPLSTADLDADGILDIIAPSDAHPYLALLRGLGGGNFAPAQRHVTHAFGGNHEQSILDLDLDGDLDLFLAGSGIATLKNQGNFNFAPAVAYTAQWSHDVAVAELDGDASPDIVIAADSGTHLLAGSCR